MKIATRRLLRWTGRLALVGLLLAALLLVAVFYFFDPIFHSVLTSVTRSQNFRVETGTARLNGSIVEIRNVRVYTRSGRLLVTIDLLRGHVKYWQGFLQGGFHWLGDVEAEGVATNVEIDRTGSLNWAQLGGYKPSEGKNPFLEQYEGRITMRRGFLNYRDERESGFMYQVHNLEGYVEMAPRTPIRVKMEAFSGKKGDAALRVRAHLDYYNPDFLINLSFDDLPLTEMAEFPGLKGQAKVERGTMGGLLQLEGRAPTWAQVTSHVVVTGKINLKNLTARVARLPVPLERFTGEIQVLGSTLRLNKVRGRFLTNPVEVSGDVVHWSDGLGLRLAMRSSGFDLSTLRLLAKRPVPLKGIARLDFQVRGELSDPRVMGSIRSDALTYQNITLNNVKTDFSIDRQILELHRMEAMMDGGRLAGSGTIFLNRDYQMMLRLQAENADLRALGLQQSASFNINALGKAHDPLLFGRGTVLRLPPNPLGLTSAGGQFLADRRNVFIWNGYLDGQANYKLPFAFMDVKERFIEGSVQARGFDVPAMSIGRVPVSGNVDADVTAWGDLDTPEQMVAVGQLLGGHVQLGQAEPFRNVRGPFHLADGLLSVPWVQATFGGGDVAAVGSYSLNDRHFQMVARGDDVNLHPLVNNPWYRLPLAYNERGDFMLGWDFLPGRGNTFRGSVDSPGGDMAALGVIPGNGRIGLVAWADNLKVDRLGFDEVPAGTRYTGAVALADEAGRQAFYYDGSAQGARLIGHGYYFPQAIQLQQALVAIPNPRPVALNQAPVAYRLEGEAYPFLGPNLAKPLERIPVAAAPPSLNWGLMSASGRIGLRGAPLNLEFATRGLDLAWLAPWLPPNGFSFAGAQLAEAQADASGRVTGTYNNPRIAMSFDAPWIGLRREENTAYFSMAGNLRYAGGQWNAEPVWVSPRPYDVRLHELTARVGVGRTLNVSREKSTPGYEDLARLTGVVRSPSGLDLRLSTGGFPLYSVRPLLPPVWSAFVPSGRLRTANLRLWGPPARLAAAGRVSVEQGSIRFRGQDVPLDQAYVDFSSAGGALSISDLLIQSGPVTVQGRGGRSPDGRLAAQIWADQVPLEYFHPLGTPWSDWNGTVSLAATLGGRGFLPSDVLVAVESPRLTYRGSLVTLEELTFGRILRDRPGQLYTDNQNGVRLAFEQGKLIAVLPDIGASVRTPEGGRVVASGRLALHSLPLATTIRNWLTGETGPEFGDARSAFRVRLEDWKWRDIARMLGVPGGERHEGSLTGELRLAGQWFREHLAASAPSGRPLVEAVLEAMDWAGPTFNGLAGVRLTSPMAFAYERRGSNFWLRVPQSTMSFFRRVATVTGNTTTLGPEIEQGSLQANADMIVADVPTAKQSTVTEPQQANVSISNVPLENLAALAGSNQRVTGDLQSFDLRSTGPLLSPDARMSFATGNFSIGEVPFAKASGALNITSPAPNHLRFATEGTDALQVFFGNTPSVDHMLTFSGLLDMLLTRERIPPRDRLTAVWRNYSVRGDSPLNAHAEMRDQQMSLLQALLPQGSRTTGRLLGNLDFTGTLDTPELGGIFQVEGGGVTHPNLGTPLTGLNLLTRFERIPAEQAEPSELGPPPPGAIVSRYTLERLEGFLGGQPFQGSGKAELVGLNPTFLDVDFQGSSLPLRIGGLFSGQADVNLDLSARAQRTAEAPQPRLVPVLTGSINIPQGELTVPLNLFSSTASAGLGSWSTWLRNAPIRYDLDLRLGDDVWVGVLNSSVRAQGDLKVLPSSKTGLPALAGRLFLSRGVIRIPLYEVNFRVRQGYAYFEEDIIPHLENVEADTNLGQYQITARFDGKWPDINAEFVSNPPLADNELNRLIGLGNLNTGLPTPSNSASLNVPQSQGGTLLANQGLNFLTNLLTGGLTQEIGRALAFSEVTFDVVPPYEYVIRVAKALDNREQFLLTFLQVIRTGVYNNNEQQYGVEWRFQPNLMTRVSVDNFGRARLWFQGVLRF